MLKLINNVVVQHNNSESASGSQFTKLDGVIIQLFTAIVKNTSIIFKEYYP